MTIRRAETHEFAEIAAIQAACLEAAHWDVAGYLQYDVRVAVAGQIVGFLVSRSVGPGESEILNLAVLPDFRRQGIARELIRSLTTEVPGDLFLEVRESNRAARNLYKSMGFQEVNRRLEYYEFPPEAAIVMKFHSC
jgi:ribosomal-protein-alanine N-acetyltransferase